MLLLQELNLELKNKKGTENVVVDHLFRLNFDKILKSLPFNKLFLDEQLMSMEVLA